MTAANGTLKKVTDAETGESLTLVPQDALDAFSMAQYLATVNTPEAIAQQQQLAAAYDAACKALVGPNDVQREGSREFKKKSAWRKLQRHFRIHTQVVSIRYVDVAARGSLHNNDRIITTAEVIVEAVSPWGQRVQAVGSCGYDEESLPEERPKSNGQGTYMTKGKELTLATMVSTAETRATNRAVSNLIAMGEVSAEEIRGSGQREQRGDRYQRKQNNADASSQDGAPKPASDAQFQFAENLIKSSALNDVQRKWAQSKIETAKAEAWDTRRFSSFIDHLQQVIADAKAKAKPAATEGDTAPSPTATATTADAADAPAPTANTTTTSSPTSSGTPSGTTTDDEDADFGLASDDEEYDEDLGF